MSNPAFIVDGFTEKLIIQRICPGQPISRTDLNGRNVSIQAIGKKIASLIRLFNNRNYPIIIIVDKEERDISREQMIEELEVEIIANGINDCDFRIGVADRMIENWIIADWESLTNNGVGKPAITDGLNGASIIKKIKGSYGKTTDGVELFLSADQSTIYENSTSFKDFADKLNDIGCEYINNNT